MFRGGADHSGVYDSAAPSLTAVKWRFHTGGAIFSSATISNGIVYAGSNDGKLYAVRAADGTLAWSFSAKGAIRSSPAVDGDTVFFSSLDGNVYAVDAGTGRERWHFATEGERRFTAPGIHGIGPRTELMPDPFDVYLSSPAIAGGAVYVGSGDHHVYALDEVTGAQRWKFATGNVVHASPAVAGGTVYVGSWDRYFYALDAKSGELHWKFQTGDDRTYYNQVGIPSSAAVAGGKVFFGCRDSHFYALDAQTGKLAWSHDDHGSWVVASPAVADGVVYFTTSDEKTFFALDASTGTPRFSVKYGAYGFSSPAIAGNEAYFGTFDGRLYGVDVQSGKIVSRFATDASRENLARYLLPDDTLNLRPFYSDPTLDGIITGLSRVYALGSIAASPAIANGVLYVGSTEGTLYAIT
jgi:outer membrane protein assembly factor BamB